jgi:hypothetical protein
MFLTEKVRIFLSVSGNVLFTFLKIKTVVVLYSESTVSVPKQQLSRLVDL